MKHGKRPTMKQKIRIKDNDLNPENWLVVKDTTEIFEIVNRKSKKIKSYSKEEK